MRFFNKLKSVLLIAASLCCFSSVFAETKTGSYAVAEGDPASAKEITSVEGITMTYGTCDDWTTGETELTVGDKTFKVYASTTDTNPSPNSGKVPTKGAFVSFKPQYSGTITAVVSNCGNTKSGYVVKDEDNNLVNGTVIIDGKETEWTSGTPFNSAAKYNGGVTFAVEAGSTYYFYLSGSKMRIQGFIYTYDDAPAAPELEASLSNVSVAFEPVASFTDADTLRFNFTVESNIEDTTLYIGGACEGYWATVLYGSMMMGMVPGEIFPQGVSMEHPFYAVKKGTYSVAVPVAKTYDYYGMMVFDRANNAGATWGISLITALDEYTIDKVLGTAEGTVDVPSTPAAFELADIQANFVAVEGSAADTVVITATVKTNDPAIPADSTFYIIPYSGGDETWLSTLTGTDADGKESFFFYASPENKVNGGVAVTPGAAVVKIVVPKTMTYNNKVYSRNACEDELILAVATMKTQLNWMDELETTTDKIVQAEPITVSIPKYTAPFASLTDVTAVFETVASFTEADTIRFNFTVDCVDPDTTLYIAGACEGLWASVYYGSMMMGMFPGEIFPAGVNFEQPFYAVKKGTYSVAVPVAKVYDYMNMGMYIMDRMANPETEWGIALVTAADEYNYDSIFATATGIIEVPATPAPFELTDVQTSWVEVAGTDADTLVITATAKLNDPSLAVDTVLYVIPYSGGDRTWIGGLSGTSVEDPTKTISYFYNAPENTVNGGVPVTAGPVTVKVVVPKTMTEYDVVYNRNASDEELVLALATMKYDDWYGSYSSDKMAQAAPVAISVPAYVPAVEEEDNMTVVKSWDFTAMSDTVADKTGMTYSDETVKVGGTASNLGTGLYEGLAMQGANNFMLRPTSGGWGGLYSGNGGGRKVGVLDLVPGQVVTVVTNGECMSLADATTAEQVSMETVDGKTTYVYNITAEGMLALTMTRYFTIHSIEVKQQTAYLTAAMWDFTAMSDTVADKTGMTYSDETVKVGGTASNLGTGLYEGLAMQGANNFMLRPTSGGWGGLYSGNGGGRKVGVLDLTKGSIVTVVTNGECMSLADATNAEQVSMETVDGKTTYVYNITADGMLALTMTRYFTIHSIKVEKMVKFVAAPNWDFAAMSDTVADKTGMTYSDETVKVGGTASNLGTGLYEGLAMQGANNFMLRPTSGGWGGLYSGNGGGRKVGVLNMTAGSVITVVTNGECMTLADATVAEQTSMETVDGKTTYVYTMTADGILALTMTRYFTIHSISVLAVQADIKAPTITVTGNTYDVMTVSMECATNGASIYYTIDGGAETLYTEPFQLTTSAKVVAWSATEKATSKTVEKDVTAGFVPTPTATITGVHNETRTITLASSVEGATISYLVGSLTEEKTTDLTQEMFLEWDSATEPTTSKNGYGALELNVSSGLPYGNGNVSWLLYADLSAYKKLIVTVSEGAPRFCFNRITEQGQDTPDGVDSEMIDIPNKAWGTERYQTVEGNVYTIDLAKIVADQGYAHLNCIKGANWANVTVTSMQLVGDVEKEMVAYTEPFVISDTTTVWAVASKVSAVADTLTFSSATMETTLAAGTVLQLAAPTYVKATMDSATTAEYAKENLSAIIIEANQSSVLCTPTASITYEYFALNAETGRVSEVADQSGAYTDTLKALPLGLLKATASAEGYAPAESHMWLKAPANLQEVWAINFDTLAGYGWTGNPVISAAAFKVEDKEIGTITINNSTLGHDTLINENFGLQTGTSWLMRFQANGKVEQTGLYQYNSGGRAVGLANLKKNQVVKVTVSDASVMAVKNSVLELDAAQTSGNDLVYRVTADGNSGWEMTRYHYIHTIGVYDDPTVTAIPEIGVSKVDGVNRYVGITSRTLGADIYYTIGTEEYADITEMVVDTTLLNDTIGGIAPEFKYDTTYVKTGTDTTIVYGEYALYTEPLHITATTHIKAYATYQDVDSDPATATIETGTTVKIAKPVITYVGTAEGGKQFTITVDNSDVLSTPETPIYYTLAGGEKTLYEGTLTVANDVYGWLTATAELEGYETSEAANRYVDARETYNEVYEALRAADKVMPTEVADVEFDNVAGLNLAQEAALVPTGRAYVHYTMHAGYNAIVVPFNMTSANLENGTVKITDAAGKALVRGTDFTFHRIQATTDYTTIEAQLAAGELLHTGNLVGNTQSYLIQVADEYVGQDLIFVSTEKPTLGIQQNSFEALAAEGKFKVVNNRRFQPATATVPVFVVNDKGTKMVRQDAGAVIPAFSFALIADSAFTHDNSEIRLLDTSFKHVYKDLAQDTIFLTTPENMALANEEKWARNGDENGGWNNFSAVTNKKGTIDPMTGEECSSTVFPGVMLKNNGPKTVYLYVTNVASFKAYVVSTGGSDRTANCTATATDGTVVTGSVLSASYTSAVLELNLDPTKSYELKFDADADVMLYGINFKSGGLGIDGINAELESDGIIYDLTGRRVQKLVKGQMYIQNGVKFLVK